MHRRVPLAIALLAACAGDKGAPDPETATGDLPLDADADGYSEDDCDDASADVHPGAAEACDGLDNDCDGTADDGVMQTFYADSDDDGFGDAGVTTQGCSQPEGFGAVPNDCDDGSAESYPGAPEQCDGSDNNCDGETDEDVLETWHPDADGDGYGDADSFIVTCDPPPGEGPEWVADGSDCDDTAAEALPGGAEVCDEIDNDCDGEVDEGTLLTWYIDTDGDGFGTTAAAALSCDRPTGYAETTSDCDDGDASVSPVATEVCDDIDNDCDGDTDESSAADAATVYRDSDSDGYGDAGVTAVSCDAPPGYAAVSGDCDDADGGAHPGGTEVCDDADNDCDGDADESAADESTFYADNDGDGYGGSAAITACDAPAHFVSSGGDCDDGDKGAYPGATEVCDDADNDCDSQTDEGVINTYYLDDDEDGHGDPEVSLAACSAPDGEGPGWVSSGDDCDDDDAASYPGGAEICDGIDNDCDAAADEDTLGQGELCPALSCAAILADQPSAASGEYWLDPEADGGPAPYACDMTTDGGGWTAMILWNREDDGDTLASFFAQLTEIYDNMTVLATGSDHIYWADYDSTADAMIYERTIEVENDGELRLDLHYYGYSMDNSALFLYADAGGQQEILCRSDNDGGYNTEEMAHWPYTCSLSADTSWTWDTAVQASYSDPVEAFHFRSFHYDGTGGDYSYLYRLNLWVR